MEKLICLLACCASDFRATSRMKLMYDTKEHLFIQYLFSKTHCIFFSDVHRHINEVFRTYMLRKGCLGEEEERKTILINYNFILKTLWAIKNSTCSCCTGGHYILISFIFSLRKELQFGYEVSLPKLRS